MDPTNSVEEEDYMHLDSNHEIETEIYSTSHTTNTSRKKRKLTSSAWNHFSRIIENGKPKAVCNYCKSVFGAKSQNGTSHLQNHIKRCKLKKDIECRGLTSPSVLVPLDPDLIRLNIARMIILHEYPLSMVEHEGFINLMKAACPMFKMVSRNTIRSDIIDIYEKEKEKSALIIAENRSRIAITTDMWTAGNQKRGYMTVTTHYIDETWTLRSRILSFVYVPCPHNSVSLCEALINCLVDWRIDAKLTTLTVDNCTTNDAMILSMKENLPFLLLGGTSFHMRCCAHVLNLIVKDGLTVFTDGIAKIRDSVAYWSGTPKRLENFEETARAMKIDCKKRLQLDCVTRWNSTYTMLAIALPYKNVFSRLRLRDPRYKTVPSDDEWELARELCERLAIFNSATELFSGVKYPIANLFFPKVCEIKMSISHWMTSDNEHVRMMASKMITKFDKYWEIIHGVLAVATVLDPRYKLQLIEFFFPKLYGDQSHAHIERIRNICYELEAEYKLNHNYVSERNDLQEVSADSSSDCLSIINYVDPMSEYDVFISTSSNAVTRSELDLYLEQPVLPRTSDFDILSYWKTAGNKYPVLKSIARDILAVPVSTVASESVFSTGGRYLSPHRSRLHPRTLEALICSQNWICNGKLDKLVTLNQEDADVADEIEPYAIELDR